MSKKVMGKGLGALIQKQQEGSVSDSLADDKQRVRDVAIDLVVPSPLQPRVTFIEAPLDDLMESIRQHGVIQPLIVRLVDGKYELIAGERRWRASRKLGLATVPVIERVASNLEVLEMALIENLQREDLNPIEEASGYTRLAREFSMKQEDIAKRVGKSRASVANAMRLLDLPNSLQIFVAKGNLSVGHAKAILSVKDGEAQEALAEQCMKKNLTVRAIEKLAQSWQKGGAKELAPATREKAELAGEKNPDMLALEEQLKRLFSTNVMLHHTPKKGQIVIEYYGDEDLQRIMELLGLEEE